MATIAMHATKKLLIEGATGGHPGTVKTTTSIENARAFADQAHIDEFVTARGDAAAEWVAVTVPHI